MPTVTEYEAFKARQQQAGVGKANIVLGQDWKQEPDQFAADLNFAKEASAVIGNPVPVQLVSDPATRNVFERIIAEKKQSTILTQSPKLADWLRTPGNADLTRDDLEGLSWWETSTGAASNAVQRGITRLPQMYNQWMAEGASQRSADQGTSFGDIYGQERANVGIEGKLIDTAVGPITDLWSAGSRFIGSRLSEAFGGDQQQAAAYYQQQAGEISKQIAAIPMSPAASGIRDQIGALEPTGDMMADVGNFLRVMGSDPAGFTAFLAETAAETAPTLAAAFGVGVVSRNPTAVATTLGTLSGVQERFLAPTEFLQERGFDVSTPEGAMAAISDPDLMRAAAERGEIRGVIIGALDTISGGIAGETLARSPILNLALQSVIQAAFGGAGEAGAQIASGQQLNVSEVLIEAMAEFVTAPLDVASMASARFMEGVQKSRAAAETATVLEEIAAQATASVTRTRSPDTFRDFIATVTANGSRENLFVPAAQFVEYFQGAGLDPFELADQLSGMSREDVETAIETGGSVQIPTATWAADMAGSEHDQFVIQNSAFSPDAMTSMQAAEFEAVKNDLLAEAWAEAEAVRAEADSLRQIYDQELEQAVSGLRAAGRATDVATAEAMPLVAFRRTMAERMGLTPEEFAARYPLPEVRGERPVGLDPKNVDELTRTLAEARGRRSVGLDRGKTPLLEFISERGGIVDPGGELRNLGADVVKRPGKKTLKLERSGVAAGMRDMLGGSQDRGLDTTARAAVESGFLGDDPDVLAWLEAERNGTEAPDLSAALLRAIEREVAGEVEVAADALGGIEEYLAGLGLSLADSDADIRAALEGEGEGRAYGQGKPAGLKEFLKNSKVKKVVYHATSASFDTFDTTLGDLGAHFGTVEQANKAAERGRGSKDRADGEGASIMPVYINVESPLRLKDEGSFHGWSIAKQLARKGIISKDEAKRIEAEGWREQGKNNATVREAIKSAGYDSIVYKNETEGTGDSWLVFDPTQVKSATGNSGAFDPSNPNILYQSPAHLFTPTDPTATPEFSKWFGDSKVVGPDGKPLVVYHGTDAEIDAFDPAATRGGRNTRLLGEGFYFTTDRDQAAGYGKNVIAVYLRMENPRVQVNGLLEPASPDQDGTIAEGTPGTRSGERVFVVKDPTQIKSVNNRGTFDPADPRILYQPAYHGTPHLFEKFSTDHIGSGEGAQAFGWGLYFAGRRQVAEYYRTELSRPKVLLDGSEYNPSSNNETLRRRLGYVEQYGGIDDATEALYSRRATSEEQQNQINEDAAWLEENAGRITVEDGKGRLFEVEVPDDADLLNWDAPLVEQPDGIRSAVEAITEHYGLRDDPRAQAFLLGQGDVGRQMARWYASLAKATGSDRAASEALRTAGIPGHRYLDGGSRDAGGGSYNYVIYDDTRVSVRSYEQADAGFQGGGARGSIQFPGAGIANGQTVISLFKSADLSTFLHETGHYFLTVLQDMARLDPTGQAAAELETVKAWWRDNADAVARDAGNSVTADDVRAALDNGTSGDAAKDQAIDTGMQEQWARATEQYFLEGKAPSQELRGAFEKFQAWLMSIYKNLRGLNVQVTDELRGVFDRMLATDTEIDNARADIGADVNLTADDLGMTAEQFAGFLKLRDQARDEAKAKTLNEAMMPIRRAATAAYKKERQAVRDRIETETKQQPVYRAIQELRFGRAFDGTAVDNPLKLNRAMIEAEYGAGYIPFLPGATKDGRGHKNAVFSVEGGVHPDIAAGAYGFPTGRDMLDALANAPDMMELIEAETAKEMEFRHNDPLKDGSIQQTAMDAVHGDLQGRVLASKLEAFNEIAGTDRGLTHKDAREIARRTLRGMAVRDATRADRFLAAERKAAGEVAKLTATVTRTTMWADAARRKVEKQARGAVRDGNAKAAANLPMDKANETAMRQNKDAAALVEASRRQLLNHMLYSEARKVEAETESVIKRVGLLRKANARLSKTRDINFIMAARAVAAKFGLTRADTPFDFNAWLEQLRFDDPVTASAMVNTIDTYSQEPRHFKDLTVSEFGAVKDAIDSLLAMSKTTRQLEIDGVRVDRREAIDALIAGAEPRGKPRIGLGSAPTKGQKTWISALTTGAALVRTEAWARDMDDGKAGVYTRYIVKPVMDALAVYRADKAERLNEFLAIVEPRRGELLGAAVNAPEIGEKFENKGALLHALLHTGNESNKKKLLLGRGWSKGMINAKPATTKAGKPRVDRQGQPIMDKGTLDTTAWDTMIERMIADGTITSADKKMIEDIWTLMDKMKRPAQAAHKKIYGHYFAEIEAAPFTNALGTWRGGYVPAIIDQWASIDAGKQDAAAALDSQMDASMFPTTGSGFTKGRVEYNQPLALNLQSLPGHMDKVLRFTHLEPTIRQTSSLLTDQGLREAIGNVNRDAIDAILTPWLVRTARQAVETPETGPSAREAGKVWRTIRKRTGLHMMALNIVNAAQQVTGIPTAAVLVKVKHLTAATVRFAKDGGTMRTEAVTASAMMRDRMDNSSRMTADEIDKIIVEPTTQAEVGRFVNQHGYVLQQVTQNLVDLVVWHGAYDQATQQGMTADDAVFEADSVVRRTQGSFNPEDVSTFETGTASQRVLTMFYSYFNTMLNLVGGEAMTEIRTVGWKSPRLFSIYFFGVLAPAVLAEAVSQAARGELGDEDDDGLTDDMLELFLGSQVKFLAGMVPFVGPLTVAAINNFNKLQYDDKLSLSPAVYVGERVVRAPATVIDAMRGEGSPSRAVADGITALGLITGIPTGQLAKSAGYLVGIGEGKSEPQNALDVLRGVTSGRDGTE